MGLSRNPIGPLRTSTLAQFQDVLFFTPTNPPDIEPEDTDIVYTIKIADRLDNIAAGLLGNEQLGWVILHRNNLRLAPNDLVPGRTLFVPTRESLTRRGII